MREIKRINIKNRTYHFYNDRNDLKDFDAKLLKIDKKDFDERLLKVDKKDFDEWLLKVGKKDCNEIDIYYIGYVTIKKI